MKKIFAEEDSHFLISRFRTITFIVWHCYLGTKCSVNTLNQLQLLQNNSIRAIVGLKKSQHVTSSYRDLEIKDLCNFDIG